jgi:hypothetical protein
MRDDLYRKYLKYKIFLNTSNGTYRDVLNGLKMFVPDIPLYYAKNQEHPATMHFDAHGISDTETDYLFSVPIARAAGVRVVIRARTRTPLWHNINALTLARYKCTRKTPPMWVRPGDERKLFVAELAQFKKMLTNPQPFGIIPK